MAWTTPKTWSNGGLSATDLNALRDQLIWLKAATLLVGIDSDSSVGELESAPYACAVARGTQVSLPTGTNTTIEFPTEYQDSHAFHSTSTNPQRITIPAGGDGDYDVGYTIAFAANATGDRTATLGLNGAAFARGAMTVPAASGSNETVLSASVYVPSQSAGNYFTLIGRQGSGGALNVTYALLWVARRFV